MHNPDLKPLFDGANDEQLLCALSDRIRFPLPRNDSQRAFCDAWNATLMLNGDGFEMLLEQAKPLSEYADAFVKIGMPEVKPTFDRVIALIPAELFAPDKLDDLLEFARGRFEELKLLLYEFFDASKEIVPVISHYVRQNRDDFEEFRVV
jgi:hypothetical protein